MTWLIVAAVWLLVIVLIGRANHAAHRNKPPRKGERGKG